MGKKDIVLKKKKSNMIYILIITLLVVIIGFLAWPNKKPEVVVKKQTIGDIINAEDKKSIISHKLVTDNNGELLFPVDSFSDEAQYFKYDFSDKSVNFFILKSNNGTIRSAFDACDVCYRSKKGYTQIGDEMQCNNCGQTFPEDKINVVLGGCNPSPLEREIIGENLVIKVSDIEAGKRFF